MIDDLLARAEPTAPGGSAEPQLKLAIVTCMDARIDPAAILGLKPGDAHVIRNAGGLVTEDALRSLVLSQSLLGTTQVMVVQHTRCGLHGDEDDLREKVAAAGAEPPAAIGAFADLDASVREQVARAERLGMPVRGFVYDVETGALREVTRA